MTDFKLCALCHSSRHVYETMLRDMSCRPEQRNPPSFTYLRRSPPAAPGVSTPLRTGCSY